MLNFILGLTLGGAAMFAAGEYACQNQPVHLQEAKKAYYVKISEGPKRDRMLVTLKQMEELLAVKNAEIDAYRKQYPKGE